MPSMPDARPGAGASPALALAEDVLLTLGNLRCTLAWLAEADAATPPDALRAGLARLERQLARLEAQARDLLERTAPGGPPPLPRAAAYAEASGSVLAARLAAALD